VAPVVSPVNVPPASVSVHSMEVMEEPQALENTCQYISVTPETQVEDKITLEPGATKENQTSSSGVPELDEHAPVGVTPEAVAEALVWLLSVTHVPSVGMVGKAVAPAQSSLAGPGGASSVV
jgi:hypothetical protein